MSGSRSATILAQKEVKKASEAVKVNGDAQYKDGNMLMPYVKDGKTSMVTAEQMKKLLDKKEHKSATVNKKKSTKPKVETPPEFQRDNTTHRDVFIEKALKEIKGLEKADVKVDNKTQPTEPILKYKGKLVMWCAPRSGMLWTAYEYGTGQKDIVKIHNEAEQNDVFDWLRARCKELDELPRVKAKTTKKSKGKKNDSVIQKLEQKEAKAKSYADSNGFSLKGIKISKAVEDWVKSKGYTLQSNSVKW